jgi:3-oxoacyl-[acyl-carrier-protein] synthase-3
MTGTVTLQSVVAHVPDRFVAVEDAARGVGLSTFQARMFRRIHGLNRLSLVPESDLFELVAAPGKALLGATPGVAASIRYLVFAHCVTSLTPASVIPAERLRDALGLADADAFSVTHVNCVSGFEALDIAGELLRANGDPGARALVLAGENPAAAVVRLIPRVGLLGHASAACLVGLDGPGGRVLSYAVRTAGQFAESWLLDRQRWARFDDTYNTRVVEVIHEALAGAGLRLSDVEMVVPHNINVSSWLRLCVKLGLSRDRVFLDNIPRYSHTYSSDAFLNLNTMRERGLLVAGGRYLLVAVGLGATYAAMVVGY